MINNAARRPSMGKLQTEKPVLLFNMANISGIINYHTQ
jgi:hypothetical protein